MKGLTETQHTIRIEIEKPLYGTYVGIRDKYIDMAKRKKKKLVIKTAGVIGMCTAEEWLKEAERQEKVYLIPDQPMILYCNHVSRFQIKQSDNKDTQVNFFNLGSLGEDFIKQARLKIGRG